MVSEAEFEVVAAGDDLYKMLAGVQRGGLLQNAPRSGATRYEMALETGRATLALSSKRAANTRVSEETTRALAGLLSKLRPELRRLDVDVDASLLLCRPDAASTSTPVSVLMSSAPRSGSSAGRVPTLEGASLMSSRSLSANLRTWAARTSRDRNIGDPFGGESERSPSFFGVGTSNRAGAAFFEPTNSGPRSVYSNVGAAGVDVNVASGLSLRAGVGTNVSVSRPAGLQALSGNPADATLLAGTGASSVASAGVGVDVAGLKISGDVARLAPRFGSGFEGTRIGGQARVSAFGDRLGLSVNWARLLPEEQAALSQRQSTAGANLDIAVADRVKLKVLYQQLFGPSAAGQPNRVIAGGVNITF